MLVTGPTDATGSDSSKDTLAQKKKNPSQVQTWSCSSPQRVFFHEDTPAATTFCYKLSLTWVTSVRICLSVPVSVGVLQQDGAAIMSCCALSRLCCSHRWGEEVHLRECTQRAESPSRQMHNIHTPRWKNAASALLPPKQRHQLNPISTLTSYLLCFTVSGNVTSALTPEAAELVTCRLCGGDQVWWLFRQQGWMAGVLVINVPSWQESPIQLCRQLHRPLCRSHRAPFSHSQVSVQSGPNRLALQTDNT